MPLEGSFKSGGEDLYYRFWKVDGSRDILVIVHGVGEHGGRYDEFAEYISGNGISVFTFDMRGYGRSSGKRGHINKFGEYVFDLKNGIRFVDTQIDGVGNIFVLGHSLGALVVLGSIAEYKIKCKSIILSGPPFKLNLKVSLLIKKGLILLGSVIPALTVRENSISVNMLTHDEKKKEEFRTDPYRHSHRSLSFIREFFKYSSDYFDLASLIEVPILIIQGGEDGVVDLNKVREFYNKIIYPNKRLIVYNEMYHEVLNEVNRELVYRDICSWILKISGEN